MVDPQCRWTSPNDWTEWSLWLAAGLHARNRWRLPLLLIGILFAQGRRTVKTWLRAAGVSDEFSTLVRAWWLPRKMIHLAERLLALAA